MKKVIIIAHNRQASKKIKKTILNKIFMAKMVINTLKQLLRKCHQISIQN